MTVLQKLFRLKESSITQISICLYKILVHSLTSATCPNCPTFSNFLQSLTESTLYFDCFERGCHKFICVPDDHFKILSTTAEPIVLPDLPLG